MKLRIEKMIYGGEGLARWQPSAIDARAKTVFVPFVLEEESVEASMVQDRGSFARFEVKEIYEPSPHRAVPQCKYFHACGGCHYQHSSYEHQLAIKEGILRETLLRTAKLDWKHGIQIHAAFPWNYRNRTRLHLITINGRRRMGYFRFRSHQVLSVEECPISSLLINRAIKALLDLEREILPTNVTDVEFFANAGDSNLLLEIYCRTGSQPFTVDYMDRAFENLQRVLPEFSGATLFSDSINRDGTRLYTWGNAALEYAAANQTYRVSSGSFFQVNRFLTDKLVATALRGRKGSSALDLYAGIGLFSLPLAETFARITAVEVAPWASADLAVNAQNKNIEVIRATSERYLRERQSAIVDFLLVDPPRTGLGKQVCQDIAALAPRQLTYISCDPSTLSRDLQMLIQSGFRVEDIHLFDLFPQTFHIETVVHLSA